VEGLGCGVDGVATSLLEKVNRNILTQPTLMTPQAALDIQIERYRQMSGEERLAIALDLHELSCDIAREGIRAQNPGADEREVERLLRKRIELLR
jgi:hypothetical protein